MTNYPSYPKTRLADMALDKTQKNILKQAIQEHRNRSRIREFGLTPWRKLLLVGPPGTGKTMTAAALAGELGVPLFVNPEEVQNDTRGVYFFDQLDDLLKIFEMDSSDSLFIGASDRAKIVDFFDEVIKFPLPSKEIAIQLMKNRLWLFDTSGIDWDRAGAAAEGLNHASIADACDQVAKNAILMESKSIWPQELVDGLRI